MLRVKVLPQDTISIPADGLKVMKDDIIFEDVPCADFRVESLHLEKVMRDLLKWIRIMPTHTR